MTLETYQKEAAKTARYPEAYRLLYPTWATDLGVSLEAVAEANLRKLRSRLERGVISGSGDNR